MKRRNTREKIRNIKGKLENKEWTTKSLVI
jgi:hypothetical protein